MNCYFDVFCFIIWKVWINKWLFGRVLVSQHIVLHHTRIEVNIVEKMKSCIISSSEVLSYRVTVQMVNQMLKVKEMLPTAGCS